jgi:TolA-binding protein
MTSQSTGIERSLLFMIVVACLLSLVGTVRADGDSDAVLRDYLSGNGLLNRGLYDLAIPEYRAFLGKHADHEKASVARYGLAVSLFRLRKFQDATLELDQLRKLTGFEFAAEVSTMSGQAHLALGDAKTAASAFRETVTRYRDHELAGDATAGLVESLYREKAFAIALKACSDFAKRWPENPLRERVEFFGGLCEMASADYEGAARRYASFMKRFGAGPFGEQVSLLLAQCYQRNRSVEAAIAQYREVVRHANETFVPDALLSLSGLLYETGAYDEAATVLDRMLEKYKSHPNSPRAVFQRALVYFAKKDFKRAYKAFKVAEKFDTATADRSAYWTGKCKLRLGEFDRAAKRFATAYDKYPDSSLAPLMVYDRAVSLVREEDADGAVEALQLFRDRFGDHELAPSATHLIATTLHNRQDYVESGKLCAEFLSRFSGHAVAPAVSFLAAENLFFAKSYREAVGAYRGFLQKYGSDARVDRATLRLATSLYRLEAFDDARSLFESVAKLADEDATFRPALLGLGDILFQRGEWKQAEERLNQYLSFGLDQPSADDALLKRGLARQRQKKYADARVDFEALLSRFGDSAHHLQARFELGQALVSLEKKSEAKKAFEAVLSEGGDSRFAPHALNHLAALATKAGDFDRSARLYERAGRSVHADSLAPSLLFQEAQSLMAAKDFSAAEKSLTSFLSRYGDDDRASQAGGQLVIAIARQDRCDDALATFDALPTDIISRLDGSLAPAVLYERAWCLRSVGKTDEAATAYRAILDGDAPPDIARHVMLELGEILAAKREFAAAATVLHKLRDALSSGDAADSSALREPGTYRLAVCAFELGKFDEAVSLFEEFLGSFATSQLAASASFFAGEACYKLGRFDRCAKHMGRIVEKFGDHDVVGPALLRLGEAAAVLQRWSVSERAFDAYLSRFGDSDVWYQAQFGRGWAREHQKRFNDAMKDYRVVIDKHKGATAARAQFQVGQCLFAKKDHEGAARELLKVDILYAYPEWSAAALFEAGRCFEKLLRPAEAQGQFRRVVENFSETEWAKLAAKRLQDVSTASALPGE